MSSVVDIRRKTNPKPPVTTCVMVSGPFSHAEIEVGEDPRVLKIRFFDVEEGVSVIKREIVYDSDSIRLVSDFE